jgi:hypothetical protein
MVPHNAMASVSFLRVGLILARLFTLAIGAAAIGWTIVVMPKFRASQPIADVAAHIIAGETYKPDVLQAFAAGLGNSRASELRPSVLGKVAIVRLRQAENAIAIGDRPIVDTRFTVLGQAIDEALSNAPYDPFLWLVLFSLDNTRSGFSPAHLRYLQMSYALGPNEGWIAIKRNRIAMAVFSALPPDLAEAAISEFVGLVRSHFYSDAADIVAGPARPIRALLFARLRDIKEADRQAFAKLLYDRGLDDVPVPGIGPPPQRPWR